MAICTTLPGPSGGSGWLLFPIEVISHCARVMSLTIRLYANMFAGGLVTLVFFSLIPTGVPVASSWDCICSFQSSWRTCS